MIEGVLGDLAPEEETAKICKSGKEEEGSSSTLGEDGNEEGNTDDEDQIEISLEGQTEHQVIIQAREQVPIQFESNLEKERA